MEPINKLEERLLAAELSDKFLDVSLMKENGTMIRVMHRPSRTAKKMVDGLNILSTNYATYKMAIDILGPDYKIYADTYVNNAIDLLLPQDLFLISTEKSQVKSRSTSPSRSTSSGLLHPDIDPYILSMYRELKILDSNLAELIDMLKEDRPLKTLIYKLLPQIIEKAYESEDYGMKAITVFTQALLEMNEIILAKRTINLYYDINKSTNNRLLENLKAII